MATTDPKTGIDEIRSWLDEEPDAELFELPAAWLRELLAEHDGLLRAIRDLATLAETQWTRGDDKPVYGGILALRDQHVAAIAALPAATCECGCQLGQLCGCGLENCECIGDCPVCDAPDTRHRIVDEEGTV